ncbi:MAG TPA: hypothetical protein DCW72_06160 [Elusimicrobia bacterium]|nr:MAG: hypothetical protein A2X29_01325 [Elusimicrobia bacterium GWA2_64_40]OGR66087.1 MAG: hypothetical protein A2X30_09600 [Elusimicrobia bacterium GWB2_63_16]HAN05213.1 hypothetical protein [Elusimicrobiota bacterium]HAU89810.1 hypothetical protein [Elusimicrobiota bacterium]
METAEKRTLLAVAALLGVTVLASTVLHHAFPGVLDVPSNAGVPHTGLFSIFLLDLVPLLLAGLCFVHAWRRLGPYLAVMFLAGSFFFTGLEENVWIFIGRYMHLLAAASPELGSGAGTYYFTRGGLWWFEIPVYICLGWFFIAYSCVHVSNLLLRGRGIAARAALGGFLAMNFDLWLDPVQVHPAWRSWVWLTNEPVRVLSIPLTNFAGWFMLVFLFALVFDGLPGLLERLGPAKAARRFFLTLIGLEAALLAGFLVYGALALKFIKTPVNLTLWGI